MRNLTNQRPFPYWVHHPSLSCIYQSSSLRQLRANVNVQTQECLGRDFLIDIPLYNILNPFFFLKKRADKSRGSGGGANFHQNKFSFHIHVFFNIQTRFIDSTLKWFENFPLLKRYNLLLDAFRNDAFKQYGNLPRTLQL